MKKKLAVLAFAIMAGFFTGREASANGVSDLSPTVMLD